MQRRQVDSRVEVMKSPSKAIVFAVACILLAMPMSGCFDDPEEEEKEPDLPGDNPLLAFSLEVNETKVWQVSISPSFVYKIPADRARA